LQYQQFEYDRFILRQSGNISLIQGNYFELRQQDLPDCKMVYDRASLIAIDEVNRSAYAAHMRSIVPQDTSILLVTLDYDQTQMNGPPFAVSGEEVSQLYQAYYSIEMLEQNDVLDQRPRWREQGLTGLTESVFHLTATPGN
jgi:thiopurine S-methyltransferase